MTQTPAPPPAGLGFFYWLLIIAAAVLVLVVWWIIRKGRSRPGDYVFHASRWSQGNHIFPAQVIVTPSSITAYKPRWIGKTEEAVHMAHVASIKIDTHIWFADILIETTGGKDSIEFSGHTKGDAVKMKDLIEKYQTEYYKAGGKM